MLCPTTSHARSARRNNSSHFLTIAGLIVGSLLITSGVLPKQSEVANAASTAAAPLSHSGSIYFPDTAHSVSNGFLSFWLWNGQEARLGKPITSEFEEDGMTVQYFERGRLEYHPEAVYEHTIQASRIGSMLTADRDFPKVEPFRNTSNEVYFAETGHSLRGGFLNYWKKNGNVAAFGYPISEEFREGGHTVQYFERARFELTNGGGVWVGMIGRELLDRRAAEQRATAGAAQGLPAPEFQMTFTGGATWFPGNWKRIISLNQSWGNLPYGFQGHGYYAAMPADLNLYGRWGRVTRGDRTLWVQFVDVIAYQDVAQVRAEGKVIDLGVESFQQFAPLSSGVIRVTVDVAWPGHTPNHIQ